MNEVADFQQDPYIKSLLDQGLSLKQIDSSVDSELSTLSAAITLNSLQSIPSTLNLNDLLSEMDLLLLDCNQTLKNYKDDIARINFDISVIQKESKELETRLKNRNAQYLLQQEMLEGVVVC